MITTKNCHRCRIIPFIPPQLMKIKLSSLSLTQQAIDWRGTPSGSSQKKKRNLKAPTKELGLASCLKPSFRAVKYSYRTVI
jgi:hypothetical protein